MNMRTLVTVLVIAIAALAIFAWKRSSQPAAPAAGTETGTESQAMPPGQMPPGGMPQATAQDPGVKWTKPSRWLEQLAEGMRLATYVVPAPKAGTDDGQCAVYYFGPGQGGGVEPNLERWIAEFSTGAKPARSTRDVQGMRVSRVKLSGTYLAHSGSPADQSGPKSDWSLLGAIVEGPNGAIFFKLTGPAATISGAEKEFDALLSSLTKP
jgi:hypothetical protein